LIGDSQDVDVRPAAAVGFVVFNSRPARPIDAVEKVARVDFDVPRSRMVDGVVGRSRRQDAAVHGEQHGFRSTGSLVNGKNNR
jgi:hypothetical protein